MANPAESTDTSLHEASNELVKAVDAHDINWGGQVKSSLSWQIHSIESRGRVIIRKFPQEGASYVLNEKKLFEKEIRLAKKKMDRALFVNQRLIDKLTADIVSNFGNPGENEQMELEAFKAMIDQDPKKATDEDYLSGPYIYIRDPYSFGLDHRAYGTTVLSYSFEKALRNGDYDELSSGSFTPQVIPNYYEELKAKAFAQAFADNDPMKGIEFFGDFIQWHCIQVEQFQEPLVRGGIPNRKNNQTPNEPNFNEMLAYEPQLEELFKRAQEKDPVKFIKAMYGNEFRWMKNFHHNIMIAFSKISPSNQVLYLGTPDSLFAKGMAMDWTEATLSTNPSEIFINYNRLRMHLPEEDLERALRIAASASPIEAVNSYPKYRELSCSTEIFQIGANKSLKEVYRGALYLYDKRSSEEWPYPSNYEDELIKIGLERYPDSLLNEATPPSRISKRPDWPEIEKTAKENLRRIEEKKNEAVEVLLKSIEEDADKDPEKLKDALLKDPAIALYPFVSLDWIPIQDKEIAVQTMVILLRNILASKLEATQENVELAYHSLLEIREKNKDVSIFHQRNVLMISHPETYRDLKEYKKSPEKDRFGSTALQRGIQSKQGPNVILEAIEPEKKSLESVKAAKELALKRIVEFPSPMTFIFDGHAWAHELYLSDGNIEGTATENKQIPIETETTIKITEVELAKAFLERSKNKNTALDILILNGCDTFLFAKNLYEELGKDLPIIISPSEYGQYGFSDYDSKYGDDFWDFLLKSPSQALEIFGT